MAAIAEDSELFQIMKEHKRGGARKPETDTEQIMREYKQKPEPAPIPKDEYGTSFRDLLGEIPNLDHSNWEEGKDVAEEVSSEANTERAGEEGGSPAGSQNFLSDDEDEFGGASGDLAVKEAESALAALKMQQVQLLSLPTRRVAMSGLTKRMLAGSPDSMQHLRSYRKSRSAIAGGLRKKEPTALG
eukprot:1197138-Rhodomonas_salina.10